MMDDGFLPPPSDNLRPSRPSAWRGWECPLRPFVAPWHDNGAPPLPRPRWWKNEKPAPVESPSPPPMRVCCPVPGVVLLQYVVLLYVLRQLWGRERLTCKARQLVLHVHLCSDRPPRRGPCRPLGLRLQTGAHAADLSSRWTIFPKPQSGDVGIVHEPSKKRRFLLMQAESFVFGPPPTLLHPP